jgi:hypothetical protein
MEFFRMFVGGVIGFIVGAVLGIAFTIGFVAWNVYYPDPHDQSKGAMAPLAAFILVPAGALGGSIVGIRTAMKK